MAGPDFYFILSFLMHICEPNNDTYKCTHSQFLFPNNIYKYMFPKWLAASLYVLQHCLALHFSLSWCIAAA